MIKAFKDKKTTQAKLIVSTVLFLVLFDNYSFFTNTLEVYPFGVENSGFLISILFLLIAFNILLFTLVSSKYTTKPILIAVVLISSLTNYFMNSYHVVIDDSMIRNMLQTNLNESMDLLTIKQVLYFFTLGVVPALFIYKSKIEYRGLRAELISKAKTIFFSLLVIVASILIFSKHYTSFAREHKPLRYSVNPTYWIYSIGKYINLTFNTEEVIVKPIGLDAKVTKVDGERRKLVIMVVGEAVRADHFSLNGYNKEQEQPQE